MSRFKAVVMGCSAGGMKALKEILLALPSHFPIPILVVQHLPKGSNAYMVDSFHRSSNLIVKEADDKEKPSQGVIYIAPPDYHLLLERSGLMVLSVDPPVKFSRPAIDELFISAAECYRGNLIGVILTGANDDGAIGLKKVKDFGGVTIVQDPETAESAMMPQAAMNMVDVHHILTLNEISEQLVELTECPK